MVLHPRHRWDCTEFFTDSQQREPLQLNGPGAAFDAIGRAAAQAGRTWNAQFSYIMGICFGDRQPDFHDGRSVKDWRDLLSPVSFRLSEDKDWSPCTWMWTKRRRRSGKTLH